MEEILEILRISSEHIMPEDGGKMSWRGRLPPPPQIMEVSILLTSMGLDWRGEDLQP